MVWEELSTQPAPRAIQEGFDPLAYLGSLIPSYAIWLTRIPEKTRLGYVRYARSLVEELTQADIVAAVEELVRRGCLPKLDFLPQEVARIAKRKRSARSQAKFQTITQSDTYACILCRDEGLVRIYHPETAAAYWAGERPRSEGGRLIIYTEVALCCCEAGLRMGKQRPYIGRYRPSVDVRVVWDDIHQDMAYHGSPDPSPDGLEKALSPGEMRAGMDRGPGGRFWGGP